VELEQLCDRIRQLCREVTATESDVRRKEMLRELVALLDELIEALRRKE
jgi:triphosphoribosyl-dephospho-CoA synthetase